MVLPFSVLFSCLYAFILDVLNMIVELIKIVVYVCGIIFDCCRDEHRFSLLHWASMMGRFNIVEMLVSRGVRINATNMGDDTALHLAAAHNHREIAFLVCSLLFFSTEI